MTVSDVRDRREAGCAMARGIAQAAGVSLAALANSALRLWPLPGEAVARLVNLSENATFRVDASGGFRAILRVHRDGYHAREAIESELAWMQALGQSGTVRVPGVHAGLDGRPVQRVGIEGTSGFRHLVLFEFVDGSHPDEAGNLAPLFADLGAVAARLHRHASAWTPGAGFQRPNWDLDQVFGRSPTWGDWRDAPGVTPTAREALEEVEREICARLDAFGRDSDRYGLVHADMRLANLLLGADGLQVIDFDDCGFGWFLYDFAAAVSFMEDDPGIPALKAAWIRGYRTVRPLSEAELAEMDSLVMLRRMALLAWIGSHGEAPEAAARAPGFAEATVRLGRKWLRSLRERSN